MALSFASSELVALCLESMLYGVYFVLFVDAEYIKVLCHKRKRRVGGNHRLIVVSATLFVLITWHEVIDVIRLYFAYHNSQTDSGADQYYVNVTSVLSLVKTSVYLAETVVSDLFILYRCYIIWNASIVALTLPVLLYLADIATGVAAVYTLSLLGTNIIFDREQERITNSFFSCTLALNAVCTGLIAFRIWRARQQTREATMGPNLLHVAVIVIESGAIYSTLLACTVASYSIHSFLFNIFLDITSPVIGIVFSLIIVRIGRGVSSDETRPPQSISYSVPSKMTSGNTCSTGPIVFKPTTTTTQMTDSGTMFKVDAHGDDGTFMMELPSDGDSSLSASAPDRCPFSHHPA